MSSDEARGLIRKADMDKNGSIDFTEFNTLWVSLKGGDDEDIRDEFHKYDADKNGFITKDEMMQAVSILSQDKRSEAENFIARSFSICQSVVSSAVSGFFEPLF